MFSERKEKELQVSGFSGQRKAYLLIQNKHIPYTLHIFTGDSYVSHSKNCSTNKKCIFVLIMNQTTHKMTDPIRIKHYKEDITSFNQLYKEFQRRFVRFANTYVRDLTTAEDITIEAMMYYWENRQSLSEDSNIPAYILTIIKTNA